MSDESTIDVVVTDKSGAERYRCQHTTVTEWSYGRVSITVVPDLPPLANGETMTFLWNGERLMGLNEDFDGTFEAQA